MNRNILGIPLIGTGQQQAAACAGYVLQSHIANADESGFALPDSITYDVWVEGPDGPVYFEGMKSSAVGFVPMSVKIKPCPAGTPFVGTRVGDAVFCYIYGEPASIECPPTEPEPQGL